MLKRTFILSLVFSAMGMGFPSNALAGQTVVGRITAYSATSLSVGDREIITVALDNRTAFTKMITQKPWEEDTRLDARALQVGRYVAVYTRKDDESVARWVQIATDMRPVPFTAVSTEPVPATASAGQVSASSDILTAKEVRDLVANAKTPADHLKLSKHFASVAAKYEADAREHAQLAQAYRKAPTASETKRPGSPDTAAHCDRLAQAARDAADAARELSADHKRMASVAK